MVDVAWLVHPVALNLGASPAGPVVGIEAVDLGEVVRAERNVDVAVGLDAGLGDRLRERRNAAGDLPADRNLRRRLAVLGPDLGQDRVAAGG